MESVKAALQLNYAVLIPSFILSGCIILVSVQFITKLLEWLFVEKLGIETKWGRKKREEHDLLISTASSVIELAERHDKDNEFIKTSLNNFIKESSSRNDKIRKDLTDSINKIETTVAKVYDDNISYREKSREIRDGLNEQIKQVIETNESRDKLIAAIANGIKEELGDTIDQKFDKYLKLEGIPANEVDEFESLSAAYFKLNGNHNRKKKYDYVKQRLEVIPVKIEMLNN